MALTRYQKIQQVLSKRQPDLTLCLDEVHKHHNVSALVRTADAVGVHAIHSVWPKGERFVTTTTSTSGGSKNWVENHRYDDVTGAITTIRQQIPDVQVIATHFCDQAVDFREIDYTKPTAIVLGQEKIGISEQALAMADQHIIIPMVGMVQSLNVSVAGALILYEAQKQRQEAGMYHDNQLPEAIKHRLLFEGCHAKVAQQCQRKGIAYPMLDSDGEIMADQTFWDSLRYAD